MLKLTHKAARPAGKRMMFGKEVKVAALPARQVLKVALPPQFQKRVIRTIEFEIELEAQARELIAPLEEILREEQFRGTKMSVGPPKKQQRAYKKARRYGGDLSRVLDMRRVSLETDFLKKNRLLCARIAAGPEYVLKRQKLGFSRGFDAKAGGGYRDSKLIVEPARAPGLLLEIQLHHSSILEVKRTR